MPLSVTMETMPEELPRAESNEKGESAATVILALAVNVAVAVVKSLVAAATGSASMVAEASHSWADAGNEIFLMVADKRAKKPADRLHPLGYGREAYVWSMVAAFGLFAVGSAVSIWHGISSLKAEEGESEYLWAYIVLGVAFVLEGTSFLQARRQTKEGAKKAKVSSFHYLDNTSNPTLRAVFAEDGAALIGLVIAALGLYLHQVTGNPAWDAIGSILVGVLLGIVAIWLIRRNMNFLNGQVAGEARFNRALGWLLEQPEISSVSFLHLEFIGPEQILLLAAVDLDGDDRESQAAAEFERIEQELVTHSDIARAILTLSAPGATPISR